MEFRGKTDLIGEREINMSYVGKFTEDYCIQVAYGMLQKRGYKLPLHTCYYVLLRVLQREGEEALYKYVKTVKILN